ncbi:hypothetical protein MUY27_03790 [Mucilaginibacter sp. RS28]|uniref:Cell wall anchor protein n=1 Tax=Mucilaginibacter straminoryzae TaxID=2932774 RepID=A0A9X2B8L0_9SPHI|nr:hypothetical protein [Mucilaginibacter straminoryzae]MCJ8208815.1 hypothetical protein [Mucilaginibacter straminoryzae]
MKYAFLCLLMGFLNYEAKSQYLPLDGTGTMQGTIYSGATEVIRGWAANSYFSGSDGNGNRVGYLQFLTGWAVLQSEFGNKWISLNPNGGNVGIGTASPQYKLDVGGDISANGKVLANIFHSTKNGQDFAWNNANVLLQSNTYPGIGFLVPNAYGASLYMNNGGTLIWGGNGASINGSASIIGNLCVGTSTPDAKLAVKGTVHAQEVKVDMNNWGDYVFKPKYNLTKLSDLKIYVDQNHHLPEIPSAQEIETKGVNLGELVKLQMKKIEELTLYLIEKDRKDVGQQRQITKLQQQLDKLKKEIKSQK